MKFNTILFDLDGTLIDTAYDLALALNQILQDNNKPIKNFTDIRKIVSHGAKALIEFGFSINKYDDKFNSYHQQLLNFYQQNIANNSKLFDGMSEVIQNLKKWGIVTNKPTNLTTLLLDKLQLNADVVVCGDTLTVNKPNKEPILYAMSKLKIDNTIFVGDDLIDIQAGKNAGIQTIAVNYGYSQPSINWGYDFLINKPKELKKWIL